MFPEGKQLQILLDSNIHISERPTTQELFVFKGLKTLPNYKLKSLAWKLMIEHSESYYQNFHAKISMSIIYIGIYMLFHLLMPFLDLLILLFF